MRDEVPEGFVKIELEKGKTYSFCTCGYSRIIPLCDGSHREVNEKEGTCYKSLKVTPENDNLVWVKSGNWEKKV
jgi:CDGSH-type Zn-finger protein